MTMLDKFLRNLSEWFDEWAEIMIESYHWRHRN